MSSIGSVHVGALTRLGVVARALTSELSPAELIEIVVGQEMAELDADGGVLALLDDASGLTTLATFGSATDAVERIGRLTLDRALPLVVAARDRTPVWVPSRADGESRFPALAQVEMTSQAWAAVPLSADGAVIGVLGISFRTPRPFDATDQLVIRTLADIAALAVAAHPTWLARTPAVRATSDSRAVERAAIALLDLDGVIAWTNDAWIEFTLANGGDVDACGVGRSYLAVCDGAGDEPDAVAAAAAIRDVLSNGGSAVRVSRFRCDAPTEERQYELLVSARHVDGRLVGATVVITRACDEIVAVLTPIIEVVRATELELDRARRMNVRLEEALASRVAIEQAKGMLAAERGITVAQAFEQLRSHARRTRSPLHEVAHAVVTLALRPPDDDARQPGARPAQAGDAQQQPAYPAIRDVSRVALAMAPLVGTDPLGQYAGGVLATCDQLLVDIGNATTRRAATVDEVLERTERAMWDLATRLDLLATNDGIDGPRVALLTDAARLARAAGASMSGRRGGSASEPPADHP